jgi:hypothetical protein
MERAMYSLSVVVGDDVTGARQSTFPEFRVFPMPHTGKVCIYKHVQLEVLSRMHDEAFILGGQEILTNALDCQFM